MVAVAFVGILDPDSRFYSLPLAGSDEDPDPDLKLCLPGYVAGYSYAMVSLDRYFTDYTAFFR